jgi:hypothetical protein
MNAIVAKVAIIVATASSALAAQERAEPVRARQITGTMVVDAPAPEGLGMANVTWDGPVGWFFVNGQLMGKLPLTKEISLTHGDYEVRAVYTDRLGRGWLTLSGPVHIERGKSAAVAITNTQLHNGIKRILGRVELARSPVHELAPAGMRTEEERQRTLANLDKNIDQAAPTGFRFHHSFGRKHPKDMEPSGKLMDTDGDVTARAKGIARADEEAWQEFLATEEWKAFTTAADRVDRAPPTHRRIRIDLPWTLGGPREVGPDQIRFLSDWLHAYLRSGVLLEQMPALPSEKRTPAINEAADTLIRSGHLTNQRLKHVQAIADQLVKAVEKAPEDQ